jgi:hypothetical protein
LLTDLLAALGREGWGQVFLAALRDDVVFNAMGRSPIAGHYEGKRVYSEEVLAKLHDRLFVSHCEWVWSERKDGNIRWDTTPNLLKQISVSEQRFRTAIAHNVCCLFAFEMPIERCEVEA